MGLEGGRIEPAERGAPPRPQSLSLSCVGAPLGRLWGRFGGFWSHFGAIWGAIFGLRSQNGLRIAPPTRIPSGGRFGLDFGPSWRPRGGPWAVPGASWSRLGPSWGAPGASWGRLGRVLGPPGGVLGPPGGLLGASGDRLGASWGCPGRHFSVFFSELVLEAVLEAISDPF